MNLWVLFATPVNQTVQLVVRIIATYDAYNVARETGTDKSDNSSIT